MSYSIKIIRKNDQLTSQWSGGKTTQLAIYPEDTDYAKRNFKWRISTAAVEVEESLFTRLPGIQRIIMPLDGELHLQHEESHSVLLQPFEQDRFDGSWITRSKGKVKDFNLMLAEGCEGELQVIHIPKEVHEHIERAQSATFEAFYSNNDSVRINIDDKEEFTLLKGDIAILEIKDSHKTIDIRLYNQDESDATMVRAIIF